MTTIGVLGDSQVKYLSHYNGDLIVHPFRGRQIHDLEKPAKLHVPSFDVVVLHVGTNNISDKRQSVADIICNAEKLIDVCQTSNPQVRIYFSSILPRFADFFSGRAAPADLNHRAELFNAGVLLVCQKRGVQFLALWELFQDQKLVGRDGLHLSLQGNKMLATIYSESGLKEFTKKSVEISPGELTVTKFQQGNLITVKGSDGKTLCTIREIGGKSVYKVKRDAGMTVAKEKGTDGQSIYKISRDRETFSEYVIVCSTFQFSKQIAGTHTA